ncbi:MAG: phosphoribosylformylglycinamidine synthase subunit PurS [Pseudomonadota bacterium]
MKATVHVTLKPGVLDPQGRAIAGALGDLGFTGVQSARQGKFIELDIADQPADAAKAAVEDMCKKLLANPVIENYTVEIIGE